MAARFLKLEKMNTLKEIAEKIAWHESEIERLRNSMPHKQDEKVIFKAILKVFGISKDTIKSRTRKREVVLARNAAVYLFRRLFNTKMIALGLIFDRDHSTMVVSYQTAQSDISQIPGYKSKINDCLLLSLNELKN